MRNQALLRRPIKMAIVGVLFAICPLALWAQDGAQDEPVAKEPAEGTEPVPLFDPGYGGGSDDPGDAEGSYSGSSDSNFDPSDTGELTSGQSGRSEPGELVSLYDPGEALEAPAERSNDGFDFAAARKLLASEMTARPGDILPLEAVLDVVTPNDIDSDLGAVSIRGELEAGLDLRSIERFRWECRNEIRRRDVTLFGNGTVRLRRGPLLEPEMRLDELLSEVLLSYLSRLARIQRAGALRHDVAGKEDFGQVDGQLGESCRIALRLPDLPVVSWTMPRLEVQQLGVAQLIEIAEELAAHTRPLDQPAQVSADYAPRSGDHLRRDDGQIFRVVGVTSDGGGVELEALQAPIRIFYLLEDLPALFEPIRGEFTVEPLEATEPEVREIVDIGGQS